ncbi:capsid protein [Paenibacillus sp. HN-1]|uniref:capsid protein n=1 Tax=Paenibacillus TaxID=44249 RepID=UPI001CA9654B|nr:MULTISPECIES: capsid protein [Paenibacillus]MBY9082374.1 capsid protein [Paenibacillus sp. CGMCC 1.18879]MBY9085322.1 capsid protein [Paenibacillus sinensis]
MGWFKNMVMKMLRITPAPTSQVITIQEPFSYQANVLRNRIWYRGDPSELDQFYKQTVTDSVSRSRFWAAVPSVGLGIRKIHSGLPAMVADRLADIVVADLDAISLQTEAATAQWEEIAEDNDFPELLSGAVVDTLAVGDGAFKITVDPEISDYPLIEFYSGDQVEYKRQRGRLQEVVFYTDYCIEKRDYRLEETFGLGYIKTRLLNAYGKEVPLSTVPETASLAPEITFDGEFLMAVPLMVFKSTKWPGRGKSLYDSKADSFDALDEVVSQWLDAIRAGRVQKYIPEDMIPHNPETGELLRPNPFDNQFIRIGSIMAEDAKGQINTVQPQILYEAFVASYASAIDMCLQGIISPSTLGIDLKKMDNAEAQREKEKATLYTRGKIVDRLNEVIPELVETVLKVYDTLQARRLAEYEASVSFGEYASPSFDAVVETVGKARTFGVMSLERAVEEMYGDTWTDDEKAEEVARLRAEQGGFMDEPAVNRDAPPNEDGTGDGTA